MANLGWAFFIWIRGLRDVLRINDAKLDLAEAHARLPGWGGNPPVDSPRFLTDPIFLRIWWGVLIIILVLVFWG